MSCKSIQLLMHMYLDGELKRDEEKQLKDHLQLCSDCQQHLLELEKTVAFVQSLHQVHSGDDFTEKVIARLPKQQKRWAVLQWMRRHPITVAASIFIMLMLSSSALSWYGGERQMQISAKATDSHMLVIEGNHVYVPEDKVIEGDLVVRHGNITVLGQVKGDVVAIDGKVLLASTAHITGRHQEIDDLLEWIWYNIKSFGIALVNP